ncbi:hypothetical protein [Novosphingobium sp.]|uniref:hypothetical protein n=1 Tax=Novosphingobium sp. TaxID=1874826 RepID=UPI003B520473
MMVTARRLRSIGWMATLVVCVALVMILAFRVNALRSQVHMSQARIIALKAETMYLETEFETRANQQQLKTWNDVEFGYAAPIASQYLDNERQLASYAKPVEPDAPAPIRVASADDGVVAAAAFPAMVSPMTGQPVSATSETATPADTVPRLTKVAAVTVAGTGAVAGLAGLGERLGAVHHAGRVTKPAKAGAKSGKLAGKKPAGSKIKAAAKGAKAPSRAFAAKLVRPKERLASADPRRHALSPGRSGTPLIKLALRDAKTAK